MGRQHSGGSCSPPPTPRVASCALSGRCLRMCRPLPPGSNSSLQTRKFGQQNGAGQKTNCDHSKREFGLAWAIIMPSALVCGAHCW